MNSNWLAAQYAGVCEETFSLVFAIRNFRDHIAATQFGFVEYLLMRG